MVISLSSEVFNDREKNYIKKLIFYRVTSTHTHTHLKSWASLCPSSVVTSLPISMSTLLATSTVGTTDTHQIVCSSYKHTHSVYAVKRLEKVAHVRTAFSDLQEATHTVVVQHRGLLDKSCSRSQSYLNFFWFGQ